MGWTGREDAGRVLQDGNRLGKGLDVLDGKGWGLGRTERGHGRRLSGLGVMGMGGMRWKKG